MPGPLSELASRRRGHGPAALVCASLLACVASARAADVPLGYSVVRHSRPDGLHDLAQTADGQVWLAGSGGLFRFDGARFTSSSLGDVEVSRLLAASDGWLWAATGSFVPGGPHPPPGSEHATRGAGLFRIRGDVVESLAERLQLQGRTVTAIAEAPDGTMWLGTSDGLMRVRPDGVRRYGVADGLPAAKVLAVYAEAADRVWVGTDGGMARGGARGFATVAELTAPVSRIVGDHAGNVWTVAQSHIAAITSTGVRKLPASYGNVLFSDEAGHVWTSTASPLSTPVWLAPDGPKPISAPVPELDDVTALLVDREGSVWAATREGDLFQFRPAIARPVQAQPPPWPTPFAVLPRPDGSVWVSSIDGLTQVRDGRVVWQHGLEELDIWAPRSLAASPAGEVWLDGGAALGRVVGGRYDHLTFHPRWAGRLSVAIAFAPDGALWVAWRGGGLARFAKARIDSPGEVFSTADGLCDDRVSVLAADAQGIVWAGHPSGGVSRRRDGQWRCTSARDGLPLAPVAALAVDARGALWLGSSDEVGLTRIVGDEVQRLPLGPPDRAGRVFGIAFDAAGRVWTSFDRGVRVVAQTELESARRDARPPVVTEIGKSDGLPAAECMAWFQPVIAMVPGGDVVVANRRGAMLIADPRQRVAPRVHVVLERISVGGRALAVRDGAVRIGPNPSDVEVQWTAPTFLRPQQLRFAYRMGGTGPWTDVGDRRAVLMPTLRPGGYALAVRAADADGTLLDEATLLTLTVVPRLWQRPWFVAAMLVGLAALLAFTHRIRMRALARSYQVVQDERGRIARDLHDNLAQGFTALRLLIDAVTVRLGATTAGIAELLANARGAVEQMHAQVRAQVWALSPRAGDDAPLAEVVRRAVREQARDAPLPIAFVERGEPAPTAPAAPVVCHELPLIVREAVTNVVRHAGATRVSVSLQWGADAAVVCIADDGRGIDEAAAAGRGGGFGLVSMHQRAALMGGRLSVAAAPAGGTEVVITMPLPATRAGERSRT